MSWNIQFAQREDQLSFKRRLFDLDFGQVQLGQLEAIFYPSVTT